MKLTEMAEKSLVRARRDAERFGIETLFLNAPMPQAAGIDMVAAVSEAGGLGVLPAAFLSGEEIVWAVAAVRKRTAKPFAINLAIRPRRYSNEKAAQTLWNGLSALLEELGLPTRADAYDLTGAKVMPDFDEQFEAMLSVKPHAAIATFGGFREPEADALKANGILNFGTATTLKEAKVLRSAEVDALIIQGAAAGGVRASFESADSVLVDTAGLVEEAVRATGLPVIASGGIAGATSAAAAFLAGASGVMIGTALLTTNESLLKDQARSAWHWAGAADLVMTRVFSGRLERVLRSPMTEALETYEACVPPWPAPLALFKPIWSKAEALGRDELAVLPLGQAVGRSAWMRVSEAYDAVASLLR